MHEIVFPARRLHRILRYADLLAGSEPIHLFLRFFYENGLRGFVGDGTVEAFFSVKAEVEPFEGAFQLPIPTLKLFLSEKKGEETVRFRFERGQLLVSVEEETLFLQQPTGFRIPKPTPMEVVGSFGSSVFLQGVDFSTVVLPPSEKVYFREHEGRLFVLSVHDDLFMVFDSGSVSRDFEGAVPYTSIRHLVKAFSALPSSGLKLSLHPDKSALGFHVPGVFATLPLHPLEPSESAYLLGLLQLPEEMHALGQLDVSAFKKSLNKAIRLSRDGRIQMRFEKGQYLLQVEHPGFFYSGAHPMEAMSDAVFEEPSLSFYAKKIKSSITRFEEGNVSFLSWKGFNGFCDEKREKWIIFKANTTERRKNDVRLERTPAGNG
ncbi:MAG TPA: hypothetical protein P5560_03745 [Thermotogota bacterium]|nr:hypothetical protein [Thermotogota bacterium]HRW92043.1 hypothetical protein [Thermotogota bacterium]